jgi:hypothetical protein
VTQDFSLKRHVYCHDLQNPPSQSRSCYVTMKLVNSRGLMNLDRADVESSETVYMISMPSGNTLGFTSSEQSLIRNEFSNFILALNLTQKRICINNKGGDFQSDEVTLKVPETKTSVTKSDGGFHLDSEETIVFREEYFTGVGIWGEIDENKVVNLFQKIQKLRRFEKKDVSQLQTMNLIDALNKYESGIAEFDSLVKFKHFFNALELVINMAGTNLKGEDFDKEVEKISPISKSEAKNWRDFYNRTKHVQKDSDDINKYYYGMDTATLANTLLAIRTSLNDLLISKM